MRLHSVIRTRTSSELWGGSAAAACCFISQLLKTSLRHLLRLSPLKKPRVREKSVKLHNPAQSLTGTVSVFRLNKWHPFSESATFIFCCRGLRTLETNRKLKSSEVSKFMRNWAVANHMRFMWLIKENECWNAAFLHFYSPSYFSNCKDVDKFRKLPKWSVRNSHFTDTVLNS